MTNTENSKLTPELQAWLKPLLEQASQKLGEIGLFDDPLIEVKPAWTLPGQVLIGMVREHGDPTKFKWFICGDLPLDHVGDDVASTPRDAARHFSLKWQLGAARMQGVPAETLAAQAEALYQLVDDDRLWSDS